MTSAKFAALNAEVVGISADRPTAIWPGRRISSLPFRLLSDLEQRSRGPALRRLGRLWNLVAAGDVHRRSHRAVRYVEAGGATSNGPHARGAHAACPGAIALARRAGAYSLFVYGTLMRGYAPHRVLARGATFVARARRGDDCSIWADIPGSSRAAAGPRRSLSPRRPGTSPGPRPGTRGTISSVARPIVTLANGRRARAWIYRYRGRTSRAVPIPDGDYRRVRPTGVKRRCRRRAGPQRPRRANGGDSMALTAAELVKADQEHLIHPLHHPVDNANRSIYVRGRGVTITGHRRATSTSTACRASGTSTSATAAPSWRRRPRPQMKELAYFSGYVGSSNIPAITLANRLVELAYRQHAGRLLHLAAAPRRTSRRSRRRASTGRRRASPTRSRSSPAIRPTTGSRCRR